MDAIKAAATHCMWKPDPKCITRFQQFKDAINEKYELQAESYHDVHKWSVENYAEFWEEVFLFANVNCSENYTQVIDKNKTIADIPQWFDGAKFNFAENILKRNSDSVAIYSAAEILPENEKFSSRVFKEADPEKISCLGGKRKKRKQNGGHSKRIKNGFTNGTETNMNVEGSTSIRKRTFAELRRDVALLASAMRKMGVEKGDRVAGYMPNCIETVEVMLAAASIGAVWSSTSPDFGITGVLDRFTQIEPKIIVSVNAVVYNGKVHSQMEKLQSIVKGLPKTEKVIVLPYVIKDEEIIDLSKIKNGCLYEDFTSTGRNPDGTIPELEFEQLPFNHPLYIMYSSGTTGVPKCMIHSAGGMLLKHFEEHVIQGDLTEKDIIMYYTTTGWMMWNWFVSALAVGAAIVCFDGSPLIPNPYILWDLIDKIGVTILGTGAKWLAVLEEKNIDPGRHNNLKTLRTILSTGSPLKPQSYDYVYNKIKKDVLLASITGGTDIMGCFFGQSTDVPVYRGELQCTLLGMAAESWDESGKPVRDVSGELVCTKPFPSMPTHFWKDEGGKRYKSAYFSGFKDVWTHGDFCLINSETQGIWMLGRSDGTLNPSGVRFGSAEIYHVVETFKEISDSLCVSQRSTDMSEERVVLFLKMANSINFSDDLVKSIKVAIRQQLSARHVPSVILPISDIPYTHNAKKVEVAVKKILAGEDVTVRGAYSNPDSLDLYKNIPELQGF